MFLLLTNVGIPDLSDLTECAEGVKRSFFFINSWRLVWREHCLMFRIASEVTLAPIPTPPPGLCEPGVELTEPAPWAAIGNMKMSRAEEFL